MFNCFLGAILLALLSLPLARAAEPSSPPPIDQARWETFLRYAEGFLPSVKFEFDTPKPSFVPGFYQITVRLSMGESHQERQYYVTADGKTIVNGSIWNLEEAPFAESLKLLPTSGPSFGPPSAPVNIVVFSDFQCPYCSEFARTLRKDAAKKYAGKIHVVFADFPLAAIHPWARAAAEGAHCLADQKPESFWAFHDWIFDHQKEVTAENLREKLLDVAKQQSLDSAQVASCLDNHTHAADIDKSIQLAHQLQVQQTPTFFVNGRLETGALPVDRLSALIDFELNRPKEFAPVASSNKCCEVTSLKAGGK